MKKYNILAVDNCRMFLNVLSSFLKETQYEITGTNSGTDALNLLQWHGHRPDLFLLDIEMPEMSGYELAKKIRGRGQIAPIIFLSDNAAKECAVQALKAGAVDYIVKPVNMEVLFERMGRQIQKMEKPSLFHEKNKVI